MLGHQPTVLLGTLRRLGLWKEVGSLGGLSLLMTVGSGASYLFFMLHCSDEGSDFSTLCSLPRCPLPYNKSWARINLFSWSCLSQVFCPSHRKLTNTFTGKLADIWLFLVFWILKVLSLCLVHLAKVVAKGYDGLKSRWPVWAATLILLGSHFLTALYVNFGGKEIGVMEKIHFITKNVWGKED